MFYRAALSGADMDEALLEPLLSTPATPPAEGTEAALFPRLRQAIYRAALPATASEAAPKPLTTVTLAVPQSQAQAPRHVALPEAAPLSARPHTVAAPPDLPPPSAQPLSAAALSENTDLALPPSLTQALLLMALPDAPAADAHLASLSGITLPPSLTQALLLMALPDAPAADIHLASLSGIAPHLSPSSALPFQAFPGITPLDFLTGPVFTDLAAPGLPTAANALPLDGGFTAPVPGADGAYPLIRPQVALPFIGVTQEHAERMMSRLVLTGVMDGSLIPRSPEWRPYLAYLLDRPDTRDPDTVFSLLLAGCAGNAAPARIALAQGWARDHDGGRFSGAVDLFAARHFFFLSDYPEAIRRAKLVAERHPGLAVKALLLHALSEAHSGNAKAASAVIRNILDAHPDSPEIPEIRYMEAWLALQALQAADAKRMLAAIIADYPRTPTAEKAAKMLTTLENR